MEAKLMDRIKEQLVRHEGLRLKLYRCTDKDYQKLQQITLLKDRLLCLSLKTTLDPALVDKVMGVIDN